MVNDCSYVAANLTPHLNDWFSMQQIKRSRGLYQKTVGVWWKIRNSEANLYHVHYALQDAWIVNKIRSLDVLHCHGSDLRLAIHHPFWGRIVRGNLKAARRVLYATPDLASVKQYRMDAEYMPTPVETAMFYPRSYSNKGALKALYFYKWYEQVPQRIVELCRSHDVELNMTSPNVPYADMPQYLSQYDVYIDRFSIPSLSKTALEAMACGLNVIAWDTMHPEEQLAPRCCTMENVDYVRKNHDAVLVAKKIKGLYEELLEEKNGK